MGRGGADTAVLDIRGVDVRSPVRLEDLDLLSTRIVSGDSREVATEWCLGSEDFGLFLLCVFACWGSGLWVDEDGTVRAYFEEISFFVVGVDCWTDECY